MPGKYSYNKLNKKKKYLNNFYYCRINYWKRKVNILVIFAEV